jgi:diacylglycerol kinase (CTP)
LDRIQKDISRPGVDSSEFNQKTNENQIQSWENWPEAVSNYKQSVKNMPRELRQRDLIKGLFEDIESFEKDARRFLAGLRDASLTDIYRRALQSRTYQLAQKIAALEENTLVQKFLRGEVVLSSKKSIQWGRKLNHVVPPILFLYLFAYSGFSNVVIWSITGPLLIGLFSVEIARHLNPRVNDWFCKSFKSIMREREKTGINSSVFYVIGMGIVYFVFPIEVAVLTMFFIAIGDPIAGIVGICWGRRKLSAHVSLEGTLACFVTCSLAAAVSATYLFDKTLPLLSLILFSMLSGLVGAVSEASLKKLDDNFVMPVLSAPILWILMKFFAII